MKKGDIQIWCDICGYKAFVGKDREEDALLVAQVHKAGHHQVLL